MGERSPRPVCRRIGPGWRGATRRSVPGAEIGPKRWHAVGVCVDITERKRAEEERERHLAEIETLNNRLQQAMTETHHRVKNNLQIISALIDMQRNTSADMIPVS